MKLTAKIKLVTLPKQADALKRTLESANAACDHISTIAWESKTFSQFSLHKLAYANTRAASPGLSSQVVIRCEAKVADAYKLDKKTQRRFRKHGAIAYDDRILSWKMDASTVSIWTVDGRMTLSFVGGKRQRDLLKTRQGESDLALVKGVFYLLSTCEVESPEPADVSDYLGVDLGIANIATDSDGETHSGLHVKSVRYRHRRLRQKLQKKQTKSASRRLRKLSGKEHRFATDVNHCVSKRIVAKAQRTGRGIAVEDLGGIRTRVRARKPHAPSKGHLRATLHSWSFFQIRSFVEYKAVQAGVPVVAEATL